MSAERVVIGDCEMYRGDCREYLDSLGPVDACIIDPPYEMTATGGGIGKKRAYLNMIANHLDSGFDMTILCHFNNWVTFCGKHQLVALIQQAENQGLRWQLLTWNKNNPTPLTNGNYLPDTEYMIHAFKTHAWPNKTRFACGNVEHNAFNHPTVKPLYVMAKILSSASSPQDVVADLYMGTGSTGVACVQLGRRFIGIEIEPRYFDIACRRIEEAYRQLSLFPAQAPTPAPVQARLFADGRA